MRWSWKVGRLAGIDLYIHWTFLLLVMWFLLWPLMQAGDRAQVELVIVRFLFVMSIFACVVLHELGHALMARKYGIRTRDITLLPIGGVARLERMPEDPRQELWVALAGPAVNLVIAAALVVALMVIGRFGGAIYGEDVFEMGGVEFLRNLMVANVFLLAFNLLPAFPMDGGRVLRALMARRMDYVRATHAAASVGQAMAILFAIVGLFGIPGVMPSNAFLLFIAIFVYIGAGQEASMTETRIAMQGLPVRHAMMTRFRVLSPQDTLETAADELMAGAQQDFPVAEGSKVVGMLRREDLFRALRERDHHSLVGTVMSQDCPTVSENEMLEAVFQRMQQEGCSSLPVVNGDRVVGLITLENVGELLMIRQARRGLPSKQGDALI